ncbi:MAG TPA: NADH:ubiquinone reductase (Na(+)-transporting) subunit C [Candidatus Omnitrophota bacterium]|nr:NADH:ubiquinone reductase (Na(+)-transporting) subunit C [Candidatus Omnitrophota bacterium]
MIDTKSNQYAFIFAIIVCVVCGVLLSAVSEGLRKRQEINVDLDIKKNILKAVVLEVPIPQKAKPQEVLEIYKTKIEEHVIDGQGNIIEGRKPADIKKGEKGVYPLYIYSEGGKVKSYAFPIVGQGLWSTLYGYLALEGDATTVRGITFYKHGETPGLGAEIEKAWFQDNFKGKTIYSIKKQELTPIAVVKGKAADVYQDNPEAAKYHVDGITAATITSSGVTEMMDRTLRAYEPYFSKVRKI